MIKKWTSVGVIIAGQDGRYRDVDLPEGARVVDLLKAFGFDADRYCVFTRHLGKPLTGEDDLYGATENGDVVLIKSVDAPAPSNFLEPTSSFGGN